MEEDVAEMVRKGICPVCKSRLVHKEGCWECPACGWSVCGEA